MLAPMEAKLVAALPNEPGWQYEPKWDGFRCIAVKNAGDVTLISKSGKPLGRYFPEMVAMLEGLRAAQFVLDGELIIAIDDALSFEALQARLHPAESRVRKLSAETPAQYMIFDLLDDPNAPLDRRRRALEVFHQKFSVPALPLSPATQDHNVALGWLAQSGGALDGVIAKRIGEPYRAGERAMLKVKQQRTADCVVGGFRYASDAREVGSLLLGLYDDAGLLNHVGFTSALAKADRPALTKRLETLVEAPGFTGKAPGGPSRWATERSTEWQPLRPELVVEVRFDQVTADRFRHGTGFLRWRPDKAARQCGMDQLAYQFRPAELAATITDGS